MAILRSSASSCSSRSDCRAAERQVAQTPPAISSSLQRLTACSVVVVSRDCLRPRSHHLRLLQPPHMLAACKTLARHFIPQTSETGTDDSMDAPRAARGPGEIRIRRAHGAVKPVRSWWTGLAGHLRPVNITPCTRPTHSWWSRPRAPQGQPPRPACRQPQRQDECGSAPRRRPRRRGAGAPAARPVAPGDAESDGAAHRRAAGPGPAADAVRGGGAAAAALITKARAPARPHEYYSEVELR